MHPENSKHKPIKKKKGRSVTEPIRCDNEAGPSNLVKSEEIDCVVVEDAASVVVKPVRERKRGKSHCAPLLNCGVKSETKMDSKGAVSESVISSSQESTCNKLNKPNIVPPITLSLSKAFQSQSNNTVITSPTKVSQTHSKHAIKHALKQQQKRQRKSVSMTSTTGLIPRIIVKPLPPIATDTTEHESPSNCSNKTSNQQSTKAASTLAIKNYRKRVKKIGITGSTDNDVPRNEQVDLITPHSILVNTNIRGLLTRQAFSLLPPKCQEQLMELLPAVDRCSITEGNIRLSNSTLNNEFFARACKDWQSRLEKGEFVPENLMKLKAEEEKDQAKIDPWKTKHFEPIWGQKPQENYAKSLIQESNSFIKNSLSRRRKTVDATFTNELISQVDASLSPRVVISMLKQKSVTLESPKSSKEEMDNRCNKRSTANEIDDVQSKKAKTEELVENLETAVVVESENEIKPSISTAESANDLKGNKIDAVSSVASDVPNDECAEKDVTSKVVEASTSSSLLVPEKSPSSFVIPSPLPQVQPPRLTTPAVSLPPKTTQPRRGGGVNLERSHQICQEVLNSSQNRFSFQDKFKSKLSTTAVSNGGCLSVSSKSAVSLASSSAAPANSNQVVLIPAAYPTHQPTLPSALVLTPVTNCNTSTSMVVSAANKITHPTQPHLFLSTIDGDSTKVNNLTSWNRNEMSGSEVSGVNSSLHQSPAEITQYVLSVNQANQQQFLYVSQKQPLLPRSPPRASSAPPLAEMTVFGNNPPVRSSSATTDNITIDNRCSLSMLKNTSNSENVLLRPSGINVLLGFSQFDNPTLQTPPTPLASSSILISPVITAANHVILPSSAAVATNNSPTLRLPLLSVVGIPEASFNAAQQQQTQQPVMASVAPKSFQEDTNNTCVCSLKAMVACRKCGAFCHDDCIGPLRLCVTCLIR